MSKAKTPMKICNRCTTGSRCGRRGGGDLTKVKRMSKARTPMKIYNCYTSGSSCGRHGGGGLANSIEHENMLNKVYALEWF